MYILTPEAKAQIQEYNISGTIGAESITKENILANTLYIDNQCADSNEFRLGGAYIGQLTASFIGVDIPRNAWAGKEISLTVRIGTKLIPTGVYTIDSANHIKGIVEVTAYDHMAKFDKTIGVSEGVFGSAFDLLTMACSHCGVNFGMTRAQVEALPNGTQPFVLYEMGDIETWRDFVYWLAVSLGSIALMNRQGSLILKTFKTTTDDTIDADVRFIGSEYGDEVITYTGATVAVTESETVQYYHAEPDDGYTLNLGQNPFFQTPQAQRDIYMNNIVAALANIQYNACSVSVPFGFQYDLGDVLEFPNGQGSATNKFCVMGYSLEFYGNSVLSGIPAQKNSKSKSDKNIQGLISTIGKNEFTSYEQRNAAAITISENTTERIILARIASNTATKAQIHVEINLESTANVTSKTYTDPINLTDIFDDVSDAAVRGQVIYLLDSVDTLFYPEEAWLDGKHVLHLMYILPLSANDTKQFEIYMKALGGSIEIEAGGVWLFASGAGLVGDGKWNGTVDVQDNATIYTFTDITFQNATDTATAKTQTPKGGTITDSANVWTFNDISFTNATDGCITRLIADSKAIITESGDALISEANDRFYTEGE